MGSREACFSSWLSLANPTRSAVRVLGPGLLAADSFTSLRGVWIFLSLFDSSPTPTEAELTSTLVRAN